MSALDSALDIVNHDIQVLGRATDKNKQRLAQLQKEASELTKLELETDRRWEESIESWSLVVSRLFPIPQYENRCQRCDKLLRAIDHGKAHLCVGCWSDLME